MSLPLSHLPASHPPCCTCPQDDVDADDGEDEEEDAGGEEDDEYMKRLRKAALRMLKGETGEGGLLQHRKVGSSSRLCCCNTAWRYPAGV
jgi:hypothetical protein